MSSSRMGQIRGPDQLIAAIAQSCGLLGAMPLQMGTADQLEAVEAIRFCSTGHVLK